MNKSHKDLLDQLYSFLEEELGKAVQIQQPGGQDWDSIIQLNGHSVFILARNEVRPNHLDQLIRQKPKVNHLMVAANYITPNAKILLKENGINYFDRSNNIWLKVEPILLHIEGNPNKPTTEDRRNRAFTKTGIKAVFQILFNPEILNSSYREMAELAGVSLGTIPKVMEGLKEEGFLIRKNKDKWMILDYKALLDRWSQEYNRRLKPDLLVKRYRAVDPDFHLSWKSLSLQAEDTWGGEPGGDLLTNYLKPEHYLLYSNASQQELMKAYKWTPAPDGTIFVYRKFWNNPEKNGNCAPPFLVYADLIETGDSRCVETANMIYEQSLRKS